MTRLLGANWRTTLTAAAAAVFSLLTGLAALPYDLGPIATVIAPAWKERVAITSAIATLILKFWNGALQKDRAVTGGTVPNDPPRPPAPPTTGKAWTMLFVALLLLTFAFGLAGCANAGADFAAAGVAYRRAVSSQSITVHADGRDQTVEAGTTIYFRDPDQGALPAK